jgi:hypothetical protein
MSDELKNKFRNLVADPPPPSAQPSQAVFAKVRTVRRRRTAGVAVMAVAAVVTIAVAGNSLADMRSTPPVTGTPGAPTTMVTGPPTTATSPTPSTTAAPSTTGSIRIPGSTGTTGRPESPGSPAGSTTTGTTGGPTNTRTPAPPPTEMSIVLTPKITGRSMLMTVSLRGTVRVPRQLETGEYLAGDTSFLNLSLGTDYDYGDGATSGSDGGTVGCKGSTQRRTGAETYKLLDGPHVYAKPGIYTFKYTVRYCGTKTDVLKTRTAKIVIR